MMNKKNKTNNNLETLIYLAKGKRSIVFLTKIKILKNNKYRIVKAVIKRALADLQHTESRIQHEANILKLINKHKIGPKLYGTKNNELVEEYIEGQTIEKFLEEETNKKTKIKVIKQVLTQCRTLDKLKINKGEMSNPYKHILLERQRESHNQVSRLAAREGKRTIRVVMIDFERSRYSESPTNVTQFFQYIFKYKIVQLTEETKQKLKDYKTNPTENNYKKLLALF